MQSPAGQLEHFLASGALPTTPSVYTDPKLPAKTDPFFSDAPIGKIYTESVLGIKPFYIGPTTPPSAASCSTPSSASSRARSTRPRRGTPR